MGRANVICFYCGQTSPRGPRDTLRRFECPKCEATNHFDEHGHIADFTPTPPSKPTHFGFRSTTTSKDALSTTAQPICCRLCRTNQIILVQRLADYLPDESHPEYEDYIDNLPEFRRQIEEQYPPLCEDCAPVVNETIRRMDYKAKVAGLGTLLRRKGDELRGRRRKVTWAWWTWLVALGWILLGLVYAASMMLLMFWHLSAVAYPTPITAKADTSAYTWNMCLQSTTTTWTLSPICYTVSASWVGRLFPWLMFTSFWNPKWLEVNRKPGAYIHNRQDHWMSQVLVSLVVSADWCLLAPGGMIQDRKSFEIWNASMMVRYRTVAPTDEMDRPLSPLPVPPRPISPFQDIVSFKSAQKPPVSRTPPPASRQAAVALQPQQYRGNDFAVQTPYNSNSFSQSRSPFDPFTPASTYQPTPNSDSAPQSPTPDPDQMDWNPERPAILYNNQGSFTSHRSSPPNPKITSRQASGHPHEDSSDEDFDERSPTKRVTVGDGWLRAPKFNPASLQTEQTGLEHLFAVATKLDEAAIPRSRRPKTFNQQVKQYKRHIVQLLRMLAVAGGLYTEVEYLGWKSVAGLTTALVFGTCWRMRNSLEAAGDNLPELLSWSWKLAFGLNIAEVSFGLLHLCGLLGLVGPGISNADGSGGIIYIPTTSTEETGMAVSASSAQTQQASLWILGGKVFLAVLLLHQTIELARALFHQRALTVPTRTPSKRLESEAPMTNWQKENEGGWGSHLAVGLRRSASPTGMGQIGMGLGVDTRSSQGFGGMSLGGRNSRPTSPAGFGEFSFGSGGGRPTSPISQFGSFGSSSQGFGSFGGTSRSQNQTSFGQRPQPSTTNSAPGGFGSMRPAPTFGSSTRGIHVPAPGVAGQWNGVVTERTRRR